MSQQEYLYKIGNLYIKSKESEYLNKYYSKSNITFTDEEYYKQIQPFIESDNIKIYNNENKDIYSFYVYNYTVYDMILNYLGLENKDISDSNDEINVDYTYEDTCDEEKWEDESIKMSEKYDNAKYIPKELFNINTTIEKKIENYYNIFKFVEIPIRNYNIYNMDEYICNKYNLRYRKNDFWNDIKYIYFDNHSCELNIMNVDDSVFDRFRKKMNKYKQFFKCFNDVIYTEIKQLLQLNNMTIAAVLIDKMNLFDMFSAYYFGENFPNENPSREFRIKQINEALEYQHNLFPYPLKYDKELSIIDIYLFKLNSSNNSNKYTIKYDKHNYICLWNNTDAIGLIDKTSDSYNKYDIKNFFKNKHTDCNNLHFIYAPNIENNEIYLEYEHNLKFYRIGNHTKFIGDCKYTKNKYLSNLVIDNSKLFKEYFKMYSNIEIYDFDISAELKDYNKFNKLFKDNKSMGNTINNLIENVFNEYIDDDLKNIFYNMYYLQMFDIIEMIELITLRKIPIDIYSFKNTNEIINKYFICKNKNVNEDDE